jgi:hypothetical protein
MANCSASIYLSQNYLSKTAAMGSTTLFTVPATGLYRISAAVEFDPTGGNNVSEVDITYIDTFRNSHGGAIAGVAGGQDGGVAVVYLTSGDAFKFDTSLTNGNSITYNLYFVVEQL